MRLDDIFSKLIDESSDISGPKQILFVLHYVGWGGGFVIEIFIGIAHVVNITNASFKVILEIMLVKYKLCLLRIQG